jgi:hypothetical protein
MRSLRFRHWRGTSLFEAAECTRLERPEPRLQAARHHDVCLQRSKSPPGASLRRRRTRSGGETHRVFGCRNDDDAFLDTFNFVPVVVSYCSRSNHRTTKQHNPPSAMPPLTGDQGECGTHTATTRSLSQAGSARGVSPDGGSTSPKQSFAEPHTMSWTPEELLPLRRSGDGLRRRILKDSAGRMSRRPSLRKFN